MKKLTFSSLLVSMIISSVVSAKQNIFIDDELLKHDQSMQKKNEQCMKIQDFMEQTDCLNEVTDKKYDSPIRGTKEYCKNNYLKKSFKEREDILKKLKSDQKIARNYNDRGIERKPGEVTAEMLQTEILIVEDSLAKNQAAQRRKVNLDILGR